tara:strand:- start:1017 stop:2090 length:1074 start_codon:yes stop_codon:yes gene_type:complete
MAKIHEDVRSMNNIVSSLGIASTDINGMICSGDALSYTTVLVSEDETSYIKHQEILEGDTETPIINYKNKKAFIIPGSSITADKLKMELKEHDIKITNDIDQADVFITNVMSSQTVNDHNIPLRAVMFNIENGYSITEFEQGERKCDLINTWMNDENIEHVIWDNRRSEVLGTYLGSCEYDSLPYNTYVYTGMALKILDRIVNDGCETITGDRVVDESPNQQILTKSLLDTCLQMYDAGGEDRAMLEKILPTIRTDVNHHLLWKLHGTIQEYHFNSRNKDIKYWFNKSQHSWYSRMNAETFVKQHDEDGTLTSEGFKYMEPIIRKEIQIYNRELYVFTVRIKPEYEKKYLKQLCVKR